MAEKFRKEKITTRLVESLKPTEAVSDTHLPGFHVRCQKEAKVYFVRKYAHVQRHFVNIGEHGKAGLTERKARDQAEQIIAAIKLGKDPSVERASMKSMPTVAEYAKDFFAGHGKTLKPSTLKDYVSVFRLHIQPTPIAKKKLDRLTRQEVAQLHRKMSDTKRTANKVLQILSSMYGEAQRAGLVADNFNPASKIKHFKIEARQRFLSEVELARLGEVMAQREEQGLESPDAMAAIRLLIFTGARLSEILSMRWEWVDFERGLLNLPDSKTGWKPIHLSPPALELLTNLPKVASNPYVIVGNKPGTHWVNLRKSWVRVRDAAELEPVTLPDGSIQHVRIHDLRHSFASLAASGGASLPMIGALLGHTQVATTARYAHLADDPLRRVNDETGRRAAAALMPKSGESAEIVELKGK
jgi:integrase